jgi:hypothetical protein
MILFAGFLLFFTKVAYVFAYGNLVQYATFLAARAYQASGADPADQQERARLTLVRLLKKSEGETGTERFQSIARGIGGDGVAGAEIGPGPGFDPTEDANSWLQGVRYTFRSRLFVSLFGDRPGPGTAASGASQPPGTLSLTSESWLGREPTRSECEQEMSSRGYVDNGC